MMERIRVASLDQVSEDSGLLVDVAGHRIALFRIGNDVYAIGDRCSHAEASLADGEVFDGAVECPRHGSEFDVRTGEPGSLPATRSVPVYVTDVEGASVYVTIEPIEGEEG